MLELKPTKIKSSRIQLRPTIEGDALPLFTQYFGSQAASKFLAREPYSSIEQVEAFLKKWTLESWKSPGLPFAWVIARADDSHPVGIFLVIPQKYEVEIHYGVSVRFQGQGYASEACGLVTKWILDCDQIECVRTAVDLEHLATQKVLEKNGFRKEGLLKNHLVLPSFGPEPRDAISYKKSR